MSYNYALSPPHWTSQARTLMGGRVHSKGLSVSSSFRTFISPGGPFRAFLPKQNDHSGNHQAGTEAQRSWKLSGITHCSSRLKDREFCHPFPCTSCVESRGAASSPLHKPMIRLGMDISLPISSSGHTFLWIYLITIWQLLTQKILTGENFMISTPVLGSKKKRYFPLLLLQSGDQFQVV